MIGGTQRREQFDRVSRRVRSKEEVWYVGPISKTVGNTCRVLDQLLKIIEDNKVVGLFTRLVSERG